MPKKPRPTPEQVAEALKSCQGLVYLAAERLDISARTVYRYVERHEVCREVAEQQKGKRLDTAEAALWKAVLAGEAWAVCFYLKTQGKARGYVERSEVAATLQLEVAERVVFSRQTSPPAPGHLPAAGSLSGRNGAG